MQDNNITWCAVCGDKLTDTPCTHPSLKHASENERLRRERQKIFDEIDKEDYKWMCNPEDEVRLPPKLIQQLSSKVDEIAELKRKIKFWHDAWYEQKEATGSIAFKEYKKCSSQ